MADKTSVRTRRDRWSDWAVIGALAIALLLGWVVKALAEGQRDTYTNEDEGVSIRYPKHWLQKAGDDLAFQLVDPASRDYKTTYQIGVEPIDATLGVTSTLVQVLSDASLQRAQDGCAYRLFDIVPGNKIDDLPSMEATYAYVHVGGDLFVQRMPVVVQGLDVAVFGGDRAYVFSLLATSDAYEKAERAFRRFLRSAELR
jgi:hypothetical protein